MSEFDYLSAVQSQIAQNNAWSAEQAQKQMDFQREMSNTAHQREIADLKASGLNPVLSAKLGGASTPSGASASADPGATSAMVALMNKMLDIQSDNAKANLVHSVSGYTGDSSAKGVTSTFGDTSAKDNTDFIADGLSMLGVKGAGTNSAKRVYNKLYEFGEALADKLKLSDNSKARSYLSGNWSLNDTVKLVKDTVNTVKNNIISDINNNVKPLLKGNFKGSVKPKRQPTK